MLKGVGHYEHTHRSLMLRKQLAVFAHHTFQVTGMPIIGIIGLSRCGGNNNCSLDCFINCDL